MKTGVWSEKKTFIYEISNDYKLAKTVYDTPFPLCLIVNVIVIVNLIYKSSYHLYIFL